uniref:Uncharacterized protein n=1 Tax=Pyramimonas orientalis virus TaxID=455367 RepID=A0A7M3UPD3_POV01|nr:hypothetical protein HWQ62_00485 [Pyramimonas orientalis virus]
MARDYKKSNNDDPIRETFGRNTKQELNIHIQYNVQI